MILAVLIALFFAGQLLNFIFVPSYAKANRVELAYRKQIDRLKEIAYDHNSRWSTTPEALGADRRLFDAPEILYASVDPNPNGRLVVGGRDFSWKSDLAISASLGSPAVSRHWFTLNDGSEVSAIKYQARVTDRHGHDLSITLYLDLQKMQMNAS